MGRLPEAWIAPAGVRELRELTRYRHKLVHLRTSCKDQVHGVLAKLGVSVTCRRPSRCAPGRLASRDAKSRRLRQRAPSGVAVFLDAISQLALPCQSVLSGPDSELCVTMGSCHPPTAQTARSW